MNTATLVMAKHITLVGMMGSGKSTVAPIVAKELGRSVVEVDALIERHEGMPISDIFMGKGEAYFRRLEADFISRLVKMEPAVLSLGGGAFQWETTRNMLLENTVVFYLSAPHEELVARLQSGTATRPLLATPGIDLTQTIKDLLERREGYYSQAHYRVETIAHPPAEVAKSVLMMREAYE